MVTKTSIGARLEITLDDEYRFMGNNWFFKWHFIGNEKPIEIDSFDGRMIHYGGIGFSGSAELVYWRTIARYLRNKVSQIFDTLEIDLANCDIGQRRQALAEAQQLVRSFTARIRRAASEKDRILRGNGTEFPPLRDLGRWEGSGDSDIQQRVVYLEKTVCRRRLIVEGEEMPIDPTDKISLAKSDGTLVKENVPAIVTKGQVITWDTSLPVEVGDHLLRQLPNGFVEDFIVDDPTYYGDVGGIGAHFQIKVRKSGRPMAPPSTIINNITGDYARVNVHSVDASKNTVNHQESTLFRDLKTVIGEQIGDDERKTILDRLVALERAAGSPSFKDHYQDFIASAANHMTVIAPFLPALTRML